MTTHQIQAQLAWCGRKLFKLETERHHFGVIAALFAGSSAAFGCPPSAIFPCALLAALATVSIAGVLLCVYSARKIRRFREKLIRAAHDPEHAEHYLSTL